MRVTVCAGITTVITAHTSLKLHHCKNIEPESLIDVNKWPSGRQGGSECLPCCRAARLTRHWRESSTVDTGQRPAQHCQDTQQHCRQHHNNKLLELLAIPRSTVYTLSRTSRPVLVTSSPSVLLWTLIVVDRGSLLTPLCSPRQSVQSQEVCNNLPVMFGCKCPQNYQHLESRKKLNWKYWGRKHFADKSRNLWGETETQIILDKYRALWPCRLFITINIRTLSFCQEELRSFLSCVLHLQRQEERVCFWTSKKKRWL